MALDRDDRTLLGLVIAPLATIPILSAAFAATMMLGTGAGLLVFGLLGLDSLGSWLRFAWTGALMGGGASLLFVLVRGRETAPRGAS